MQVPEGMIGNVSKDVNRWAHANVTKEWSLASLVFCTTCGNRLWNPAAVPAAISVLGHKTSDVVGEPNPAAKKLLLSS